MIRMILALVFLSLSGCSLMEMEGDGFYNSGKKAKPARCVQVDPLHIRCETIRK